MRPRRAPHPRLAEAGGRDKRSRPLDGICTRPDLTSGGTTLPPLLWLLWGYLLPVEFWPRGPDPRQTHIRRHHPTGADRLMRQRAHRQLAPAAKSVLVNAGFSLAPGPNHSD